MGVRGGDGGGDAGGIGEGDEIMNPDFVFTTILFDYFRVAIPDSVDNVFLFFDKNILQKNTPSHYCSIWEWGNITDECISYNQSINLDENIKAWKDKYKMDRDVLKNPQNYIYGPQHNFSAVTNEVVFLDNINFDSLAGIYCKDATWEHPLLLKSQKELKKFLNKYGIMDVDTNPRNNYFVDFSVEWDDYKHNTVAKEWLDWASMQKYKSLELNRWKKYYNDLYNIKWIPT